MHLNSGLAQCATVRPLPGSPHPHPLSSGLGPPTHPALESGAWFPWRPCLPASWVLTTVTFFPAEGAAGLWGAPLRPGGCGWSRVGSRGTLSGSQGCVLRHRSRQWVSPCPGPPGRELETQVPRRLSPTAAGREGLVQPLLGGSILPWPLPCVSALGPTLPFVSGPPTTPPS